MSDQSLMRGARALPRYATEGIIVPMRVDDLARQAVVFVGIENRGAFVPLGTGFLISSLPIGPIFYSFLVTANHVVESVWGESIAVRLNRKDGGCSTIKINKDQRLPHPDPSLDIAVFPMPIGIDVYDFILITTHREAFEKERTAGLLPPSLGDEVAVVGLYTSHYGTTRNRPVVRIGNVAALPEESVLTSNGYVSAYLIETKSIAGLSGSPVFLNVPPLQASPEGYKIWRPAHLLFGMLIGYHVVESQEDQITVPQFQTAAGSSSGQNTGFSVVVPIERVFEITETHEIVSAMRSHAAEMFEKSGYVPAGQGLSMAESKIDNPDKGSVKPLKDLHTNMNRAARRRLARDARKTNR